MANPIVTGITGYVCDHQDELLMKSILGSKSASLFRLMSGVKGATNLHIMDSEIVFGDGSVCGWDEAGTTEFSNRILTPKALKVNMAFCDKELLKTWAQHKVRMAAGQAVLPFEEEWTAQIIKGVDAKVEKMLYQGDSDNGNEFDGLLKTLKAEGTVISASAATTATAYEYLKEVAKNIPADVEAPVILVSIPLYREYMQNLVTENLFHYDPNNGENEYMLPGTDIKVIAVAGLNGAADDAVIAADLKNIVYGVDAEGDEDKFELWYSQDNREFRLAIEFVAGAQVAFPDQVVLGERK